jgi:hypothetical protein
VGKAEITIPAQLGLTVMAAAKLNSAVGLQQRRCWRGETVASLHARGNKPWFRAGRNPSVESRAYGLF